MHLDAKLCYRVLQSRDPRFDGRFFVGVRTTGVYCRPVCPARTPKRENVRFYACAAAAEAAGFRPCLRCRPESSPGTPAWLGTSATVSRALRLIAAGALDGGSSEALAARLGVGERQLRRLFQRHLGASPGSVARTRRLHFAKKILDESSLPIAEVALASGFSSVRRFNAAMRNSFHKTPSALRAAARGSSSKASATQASCSPTPAAQGSSARISSTPEEGGALTFKLAFRPPYDWEALTAFLAARAIPGVESVSAESYRRSVRVNGNAGVVEVSPCKASNHLLARIDLLEARHLAEVVDRLRRLFDLSADPQAVAAQLGTDAGLRPLLRRRPGLRVPGAWDGFELAVRAILGQQISVAGATVLAGRLVERFGEPLGARLDCGIEALFPRPEVLVEADVATIGLPGARARAIRELARAVCEERVGLDFASGLDAAVASLAAVPGIGPWTAGYIAMRALGEPDALPSGDLGLLRALSNGAHKARPAELEARAEGWRPWRAYAAMHLWMNETAGRSKRRSGTKEC